jgi:hypothetical protein
MMYVIFTQTAVSNIVTAKSRGRESQREEEKRRKGREKRKERKGKERREERGEKEGRRGSYR